MPTEITRVQVVPVAKFIAVLTAIFALVTGLPAVLFGGAFTAVLGGAEGGAGFIISLVLYLVYVFVAAAASAVVGAIYALAYNFISSISGGIVVETADE